MVLGFWGINRNFAGMKKKSIQQVFVCMLVAISLLPSCSKADSSKEDSLNGVWELIRITTPSGKVFNYPDHEITWLRIYDDSCYYMCQIVMAPNGILITPSDMDRYTYISQGEQRCIYLQGGNSHPLKKTDDSTMTIQETGRKYTWRRCGSYEEDRCKVMMDLIKNDAQTNHEQSFRYVFSKAEKQLKTTNYTLACFLLLMVVIALAVLHYTWNLYQNKRHVELQLRTLEQEREAMPEPVRQAMDSVEAAFHESEFYLSLHKRIAQGERLKQADWDMIEAKFKSVYPGFTTTLFSLYKMSEVEYRVCLLLKLCVAPSEISRVLCKEMSSVSSIRSRLYQKVFRKKGSCKDWDEFIQSL